MKKKRIAVQITSTNTHNIRKKVQETIDTFVKYKYIEKYDRLIIIILTNKTSFQKDFDTKDILNFSKEKDIININQIIKDIKKCDDEKLEKIYIYLEDQLKIQDETSSVKYVTDPPANQCMFYSGRTNDENNILSWLVNGKDPYIIRGTGGIGKTELAKAIWQKLMHDGAKYGVLYLAWVPYHGSDLKLSICQSFFIAKQKINMDVAWTEITNFFMQHKQNLLIFIDNVEKTDENDIILRSIKQYPFRTIITTREKLNIEIEDIELKVLSKGKCRELFYKYYTLKKDNNTLNKILEKTGYLTVAIELLAKTALAEEMSLQKLYQMLIKFEFDISEETVATNHDLLTKEDKIANQLKKLFSISVCNVEQLHLLINISMFPAKEFSFENVKNWFGIKSKISVKRLLDRGWLRKQENSKNEHRYWMHPVLAASIRFQKEDVLHDSCEQLIINFTNILSRENQENIFERFSVIAYAESLDMYQRKYYYKTSDVDFLIALGNVYIEMAEYTRAVETYECGLNIIKNNIIDNNKYMEICRLLGNAYKQRGNFDKAMDFYNNIMTEIESKSDNTVENVICAYRDMGHMYKSIGDYVKALDFYNKGESKYLEEKKTSPKLSLKYLAMVYYGKGNLYRCAENYEEALDFYQKAKDIYESLVDNSNFEWMLLHDNIGVCYLGMGNSDMALVYHNEALKLQNKTYKEINQPFTGLSYMYRGDVHMRQGNTEAAYCDYQQAEKLIRDSVGNKHPYMIRIKNHIAKYFIFKKEYFAAEKIELEALPFELTELGKLHPDTAELYNNLIELYCAMGDTDAAKKYHLKIKEYGKTILRSHPETLKMWMREAKYYLENNQINLAKKQLNKLIQEASNITKHAPIVKRAKELLYDLHMVY